MPVYTYVGYDSNSGATRKGKVEADSPKAARMKLRQKQNIIVSNIKEEASLAKASSSGTAKFSLGARVKLQDVAVMTRQFATLQQAHVPLDDSLKALTAQVEHPVLRNTLSAVKDQVSEGRSLADAMVGFPGVFSRLYVNMVRAGESSGTLGIVLERLAQFTEDQVAIRGKVMSAMTYPTLMICASLAIIAYLFISVVPKLTKVFASLKVTLPWYTKLLISISNFLQNYWYLVILFALAVAFLFRNWLASEKGRKTFDNWMLTMPLFGPVTLRVNVSGFTRTLSTLLTSGVPIIQALEITRNVVGNTCISEVLDSAKIAVQEGQSLGVCIERSGRFPPLVTHMILTGERTGQLEEMLTHVATAYDAEVERRIGAMISVIEPLMIIIMAGVSVTVVMAMLIPMLSVMNQIR